MKIAIIMNHNAYPGREFIKRLIENEVNFDVISIGTYPEMSALEEERCDGLWRPPSFEPLIKNRFHRNLPTLKDSRLLELLQAKGYDLGIQGGTSILKESIFRAFHLGILNFHPGDLPRYRGCSAPEWQYYENMPIISTCHLIDSGIDSGDIYDKCRLDIDDTDYYHFRASIYPRTAEFMVNTVQKIIDNNGFDHAFVKQDETKAIYRNYIGLEKIEELKIRFKSN